VIDPMNAGHFKFRTIPLLVSELLFMALDSVSIIFDFLSMACCNLMASTVLKSPKEFRSLKALRLLNDFAVDELSLGELAGL
jgi:hypothetical protein